MNLEGLLNPTVFSSVLDVIVVSFLIYRILLMVKGTRALPMLAGLGMLVVVHLISKQLGLATLGLILDSFFGSLILVVVVLFQDDLRRALIKVGLGPGITAKTSGVVEHTLNEVARAASELASKRLGALIVVTREVGLNEYSDGAVKIDAVVSHQLLVSIFVPWSPIHDGAAIIEGNRVVAAGAVLPLTFNPNVSSHLGTRHRAAIGLSEKTDALVVVVSEETGAISLVREGRITRDLTQKTLYSALHRCTVVREQKRKGIRQRAKAIRLSSNQGASDQGGTDLEEVVDGTEDTEIDRGGGGQQS